MTGEKGCLTKTDRAFLRGEKEYDSKQALYQRRKSIRDGARGALRDFALLANELDADERDKIFAATNDSQNAEYGELRGDVMKTIEFIYAGMGGARGFRTPLIHGVMNGEVTLGEAQSVLDVSPQFSVDKIYQADAREATDLVEAEELKRLTPPDLFTFLRLAQRADAIDFEAVREELGKQEWSARFVGKKNRAIPGGKSTPWMDPEVYEREGIGEMSPEELRSLFGEGYGFAIYDGEKVYAPPPPGSDDDPEILDWIDDPPDDSDE